MADEAPYPGSHLDAEKEPFNYKLSSVRLTVENAFGRLKGARRWRCLKRLESDVNNVPVIITAACILHNFCPMNGDYFVESDSHISRAFKGYITPLSILSTLKCSNILQNALKYH